MAFVDVPPVTVTAYGGRRDTTARRLVLERRQRTRGRFYLFLLYEVNTGRVRWQFRRGKGAAEVCAFLRRVRRWYPHRRVCVVLDQDPAHPRHAAATRRAMRALGLHWISLPKGSPDDNPAEVVFSDIQLMVLDHSNDPDVPATQRRISARLRRRNRRRDRFIRIGYLENIHNHR